MTYIRLVLALTGLTVTGMGAVSACVGRSRPMTLLQFLGMGYLFGFGITGLFSVIFMLVGIRIGPVVPIVLGWSGLALAFRYWPKLAPLSLSRHSVAHLFTAAACVIVILGALTTDGLGWDAEAFWSLKARSIQNYGTFRNPDFYSDVRPHLHTRYPLLGPSVWSWIYTATGTTEGRPIRIAMGFLFIASLPVVYSAIRATLSEGWAGWLTAIYALIPAWTRGAGGVTSGLMDFPLGAFLLVGLIEAAHWLRADGAGSAVLCSISLAAATQIKNEGGMALAISALVLMILSSRIRGRSGFLRAVGVLLPGVLLFAAWSFVVRNFPPVGYGLHEASLWEWGKIRKFFYLLTFADYRLVEWSVSWILITVLLVIRFPRSREADSALAWAGLALWLVYVGLWTVLPMADPGQPIGHEYMHHHNMTRLAMHVTPALFVWASGRLGTIRWLIPEGGLPGGTRSVG